ncbi:Tyrosine recombinase XerC [bioreactor metagenome]|uniref:Tyrosine recombinase XerC n=1 Tax=bioreactor metagenome TaxID=1076179 RepID=A0A644X1C0_9ZZZZ|nr:site-specific integrase [Paludibacter sp.]
MKPFSVRACIRTDKPVLKNGKYPIYLRVRISGNETKIPTGYEVEKSLWDSKLQLPKKNPLQNVLKKEIDTLETHLLTEQSTGGEISINLVKDFFAGKKKIKPEHESFYDYYLKFVEDKKNEGKAQDTIRIYNGTYKILKEFAPKLKISDITLRFIQDFDAYLRDKRGNDDGGRENKHKNIRAVILDMISHDIPVKNPYSKSKFKIPRAKIRDTYLEFEELMALRDLRTKFEAGTTKRIVLQMYLFGCYTGLRFSDIIDLKWSHVDLDKNRINKIQVKTGAPVMVIIEPWARSILLEFSNSKKNIGTKKPVFKSLTEPTVNRNLKILAKMANINKVITFHSSRHTFGTLNLLENSDKILLVSKLLGHADIKTTMVYFNGTKKLIDDHARKGSQIFSGNKLK